MAKFKIDGDAKGLMQAAAQSKKSLDEVGGAADKASDKGRGGFLKMAASIATGTLAAQGLNRILTGVKNQFFDVLNKAGAQEQMTMRLAFAVSKLGISWKSVRKELEQYLADVQFKTGFGDDRQADLLARLMMITGDYRKSLELLLPVIGLSIESNRGLEETAQAVGRAVMGFKDILGRYGVVLDENLYKQDAFAAVMKRIGPSAAAATLLVETYNGKVAQLAEYIGDIKENVGLPIIERLTAFMKGASQADFEKVLAGATRFGEMLGGGIDYMLAGLETARQVLGGIEFKDLFKDALANIQTKEFWEYIGETMKVALYNKSVDAFDKLGEYLSTTIPEILGRPIRMAMATAIGAFSNAMKGAGFIDFGAGKIAEELAAMAGEKSAGRTKYMNYPGAPEFIGRLGATGQAIGASAPDLFGQNLSNIRGRHDRYITNRDNTFEDIATRNNIGSQGVGSTISIEERNRLTAQNTTDSKPYTKDLNIMVSFDEYARKAGIKASVKPALSTATGAY